MAVKLTLVVPAAVLALTVTEAVMAQASVPNVFEAGQPARASEVNENFTAIESAVNENEVALRELQGRQSGLSREAAQIQTAYDLTAPLRWMVRQFYEETGAQTLPADNDVALVVSPEQWSNPWVSSSTIVDGDIVIAFSPDAAAGIANQVITLAVRTAAAGILWFECVGDGVTDSFLAEIPCAFTNEPYQSIAFGRRQVDSALEILNQSLALQLVEDYFSANSVLPDDNAQSGLADPTDYFTDYTSAITVLSGGRVQLTFGPETVVRDGTLLWVPLTSPSSTLIVWECSSPDPEVDQALIPAECRDAMP